MICRIIFLQNPCLVSCLQLFYYHLNDLLKILFVVASYVCVQCGGNTHLDIITLLKKGNGIKPL